MKQRTRTITLWAVVDEKASFGLEYTFENKRTATDRVKWLNFKWRGFRQFTVVRLTGTVGTGRRR